MGSVERCFRSRLDSWTELPLGQVNRAQAFPENVVSQFEILSPIGYASLMEMPVVCGLTEAEMRDRRRAILDPVRRLVLHVTCLPMGYAYYFEPTSAVLARLASLVDLERQCCEFLTFKIVIEGHQPICLEVTGPAEAKALITDFLGS